MNEDELAETLKRMATMFNDSFGYTVKEMAKGIQKMASSVVKDTIEDHIVYDDNNYVVLDFDTHKKYLRSVDDDLVEINKEDIPDDVRENIIKELI